jgi:hypothetical protein
MILMSRFNNPGTKELELPPEKNLGDSELSDSSLPGTTPIDKLRDAPGLHGTKRKISALVPRKITPAERKHLFYLTSKPIVFTLVIAEDNSELPKVTYHLKIASSSSERKKTAIQAY